MARMINISRPRKRIRWFLIGLSSQWMTGRNRDQTPFLRIGKVLYFLEGGLDRRIGLQIELVNTTFPNTLAQYIKDCTVP